MKKQELLKFFDDELMDKLYGFCYVRTNDSYEAQELCSDIIFELVKAANTDGDIIDLYSFVWRVAKNVYADFSKNKRRHTESFYEGDADEVLKCVADDVYEDNSNALLEAVYRRIAFLTKAYREVMIMFYLDGLSTAEIARRQKIGESAVRQRLFSARQKIKSEVNEMTEMNNRPLALDEIDYVIWGEGNLSGGDPRNVCTRMFSKHVLWLCNKKSMSPGEIAEKLNVPTVYVEEELEILTKGANEEYGLLRRTENGKYAINFILLDKIAVNKAQDLYLEQLPQICNIVSLFIEEHKKEYLGLPYLNKKVDFNLILWQQIYFITKVFSEKVEKVLAEKYFEKSGGIERPFSVYGFVDNKKNYGGGWDIVDAENVCGFSKVRLDNIYITRIKQHFDCGLNISKASPVQLTLRAIDGLNINGLSEKEKEHAAKAVESGYLYKEDGVLYTKVLVSSMEDNKRLFDISKSLNTESFEDEAQIIAEKLAELIKKNVPFYLLDEWRFVNRLASLPVLDSVVEYLIDKGALVPPEDGVGAEGCWLSVKK
ncbi:MAG: sigma-70 family RNA polymerase sigma factor [Clostridia bacterium]|nr:sigma-70 family RNA polymerase sigma factor [Clostridia bacterium]